MDPLHAISVPQPDFTVAEAQTALAESFGLEGTLQALVSERDQNFRVSTPDGELYVFKIANGSEPAAATDFQIRALLHLEQRGCSVPTPRVRRTVTGEVAATIIKNAQSYICRVVSFLPGEMMSAINTTPALARNFGVSAARLDLALADFEHEGQAQSLLWDLQRAGELRGILQHVENLDLRAAAESCLDDFDVRVTPLLPHLRRQVVHSDLHAENVVVDGGRITGVIDFGDMLNAPLIMEVAVASAYLRPAAEEADTLALLAPFVAGYHSVTRLEDREVTLLFDLVRARLVATISILSWRAATRGANDAYSSQNLDGESNAQEYFSRLDELGRDEFTDHLKKIINIK